MKKKICLIAQFPPPIHGLSKAVDTLYKSNEIRKDFDFIKVDITNNKRFLFNYLTISRTKADLFYLTISQSIGGNLRDLLIMKLLRKQGKKCVIHLHGGYFRILYDTDMHSYQRKWNKNAINHLSGAIVLGDSLKTIFEGLVEKQKIFVIPNCVDDEYLLSSNEIKEKENGKAKEIRILYLSNFIRSKGYDIVLKMAKEYRESPGKKELHFDFAGQFYREEERLFFFNYIKENHLENTVTYHGIVTGESKKELMRDSTFFILPTNYPKEGQPISILEAMGNGMVILSTIHAGIPDLVSNIKNGCILPYSEDLHKKYLSYIDNISLVEINQIQKRNYEAIQAKYLEKTYIGNLRHCFMRLIFP